MEDQPSAGGDTRERVRRGRSGASAPRDVSTTTADLPECPLAGTLAGKLRGARDRLVARWLERIEQRVALDANRVFPSDDLLDHVPLLIDGMADYIEDPADEITADVPLVAKALELGEMRHDQGFEPHEILKEYEILGGIIFTFLIGVIDDIDQPCTRSELLTCAHRLFRSITVIQQVTMSQYLRQANELVDEREQRLRGFHRALSHELKNRVGALQGAARMLGEDFVVGDEAQRRRFQSIATENAEGTRRIIDNLTELSRVGADTRQHKNVPLRETVFEVTRQLRDFAAARDVRVQLAEDLPTIEMPASALELAVSNYVSNAIKYHDPEKSDRWVWISGWLENEEDAERCELVVEVADNGRGVAPEKRERLFQRFFRGNDGDTEVEGTGLGLSIVKEIVETIGGRAWADFSREGQTVFRLALPCRREADAEQEGRSAR